MLVSSSTTMDGNNKDSNLKEDDPHNCRRHHFNIPASCLCPSTSFLCALMPACPSLLLIVVCRRRLSSPSDAVKACVPVTCLSLPLLHVAIASAAICPSLHLPHRPSTFPTSLLPCTGDLPIVALATHGHCKRGILLVVDLAARGHHECSDLPLLAHATCANYSPDITLTARANNLPVVALAARALQFAQRCTCCTHQRPTCCSLHPAWQVPQSLAPLSSSHVLADCRVASCCAAA